MNVNEMFPSNYLSKEDFPEPRTLVMTKITRDEVWRKNGKQQAIILHFQNSKPLVLNKTNAVILARVYGPDATSWFGKPIGVYHDPNVLLGRERVGGIRLRVPAQAQTGTPSKKPESDTRAASPIAQRTPTQNNELTINGMDRAHDRANLDQWAKFGKGLTLTPEQQIAQEDAYRVNLERLERTKSLKPAPKTPTGGVRS